MAKPSAAAGPADKGTLVRPRFRRRAQRAWAGGATTVAPPRAWRCLPGRLAAPSGRTGWVRIAGPRHRRRQRYSVARIRLRASGVHAASGLLRRLPEIPVAPARARTDDLRPGDSGAGEPARRRGRYRLAREWALDRQAWVDGGGGALVSGAWQRTSGP